MIIITEGDFTAPEGVKMERVEGALQTHYAIPIVVNEDVCGGCRTCESICDNQNISFGQPPLPEEYGVKYIRAKPGEIRENKKKKLEIFYSPSSDKVKKLEVDTVVLSTALVPRKGVKALPETLGVELDEYGFFKTRAYDPTETTRDGIFVAGFAQSPKDIAECIAHGSGASSKAMEVLGGYK